MLAIRVLGVLLVIANALANTQEDKNLEDSKLEDLETLSSAAEDDNEVKRAKKSATTTFCVEIRPSGPFQKPFQVCEPAEPAKPQEPSSIQTYSGYYAAPEQPKPEAYKPPSQPKANAIYSAPMKPYLAAAPAPKQYGAHSASYSGIEDHHGHLMRMAHAAAAEEKNSELVSEQYLRAADPGHSSYSSRSYGSTSYVPVVPEHVEKHRNHNGLVITCQPNLAGYAHNVPSSLHHPPALHSYSYRSSAPKAVNGANNRYDRYQVQSSSYGNYQQPYGGVDSGYKQPAATSGSSSHQYSSMYGSYAPIAPAYSAPHLPAPYVPSAPAVHPSVPASIPQAGHTHFAQPYPHFTQSFGQGSSSGSSANSYVPYGSAGGYAPAPVLPTVPAVHSTFSQTQSYSNAPHQPASVAPSAQGQGYATPGTYGTVGEEQGLQAISQQRKEQHTLKKMEEVSHQRATGSQWATDISPDKVASAKMDEHMESKSQQSWSGKKRETEDTVDMKVASDAMDVHHEAEDAVNRIDS